MQQERKTMIQQNCDVTMRRSLWTENNSGHIWTYAMDEERKEKVI